MSTRYRWVTIGSKGSARESRGGSKFGRELWRCDMLSSRGYVFTIGEEDQAHLLYECPFAKEVWLQMKEWWEGLPTPQEAKLMFEDIKKSKQNRSHKTVTCAIVAATIYESWHSRNKQVHGGQSMPTSQVARNIKIQVQQRILHMNLITRKYDRFIDSLLQ